MRRFTKYPQGYVKASTDLSNYSIMRFTPQEYERLKKDVKKQEWVSNDVYGSIVCNDKPFAAEVVINDYDDDGFVADWGVYLLGDVENEMIDGGGVDLSLTYDEQVDFLISKIESAIRRYERYT